MAGKRNFHLKLVAYETKISVFLNTIAYLS